MIVHFDFFAHNKCQNMHVRRDVFYRFLPPARRKGSVFHHLQFLFRLCDVRDNSQRAVVMVALWNRADRYIFILWFLSVLIFCLLLFSSPNLSGRTLDVYHTSTHGVAVVRI